MVAASAGRPEFAACRSGAQRTESRHRTLRSTGFFSKLWLPSRRGNFRATRIRSRINLSLDDPANSVRFH
jgi:hypothetical protein